MSDLPGLQPSDPEKDRNFITALARGLDILRAYRPGETELTNTDFAERTGLPKPTVSRLTYTLTLLGYLTRDPALQKYRLGSGVLSLSHPVLAGAQVRQVARPFSLPTPSTSRMVCAPLISMTRRSRP